MMASWSAGGSFENTWDKLRASLSVGMTTLTFGQGSAQKDSGVTNPSPGSRRSISGAANRKSLTDKLRPENWVAATSLPTMISPPKCLPEPIATPNDGSQQGGKHAPVDPVTY